MKTMYNNSFVFFFSFAASQFTVRVGEWDLTDNDDYTVEQEVQSVEERRLMADHQQFR